MYQFFLEHPNPKLVRLQLPIFEKISLQYGHVWQLVHEHLKRRRYIAQAFICNTIHNEETQEAEEEGY